MQVPLHLEAKTNSLFRIIFELAMPIYKQGNVQFRTIS